MDHRQPVARRQLIDQLAVGVGGGVRQHDQSVIWLASPLGHRRLNFVGIAQRGLDHFDRKPRGHSRSSSKPTCRVGVRVEQDGDAGNMRRDLLEQFEQFRSEARLKNVEAAQVSARMAQAHHQAIHDRIAAGDEDDGNRAARLLHCPRRRAAIG